MLPFTRPSIDADEQQAAQDVLASGWITTGPKVQQLEQALADYIGGNIQVRLFNSATSALEAVLLASGIGDGDGDEVIVPAMSFVASANVVVRCGATPVFVDVDLHSRNLNAAHVAEKITARTRAIMPVHFAGLAVDMNPVYALAAKHDLLVLEDAAQAIGSRYTQQQIGSRGNPVCFSFHPNKNMTTIEGGAVASNDDTLIKKLEQLRFHGIVRNDKGMDVPEWGGKMNLPDVHAAIGLVQLERLDGFNLQRQRLAARYFEKLQNLPLLVLPASAPGHSWHMFCVCVDFKQLGVDRSRFQQLLAEEGIGTGIHYPAITTFSLYQKLGNQPGDFPIAERIAAETLTLPLFPAMDIADVDQVCGVLRALLLRNQA